MAAHTPIGRGMEDFIWPYVDPPLYEPYWFEKFDLVKSRMWMEENWHWSLYLIGVYLTFIFVGQKVMEGRKAFGLKGSLALWNLGFATFSIVGLVRCSPELWYVLQGKDGFHRSVCVRDSHNEAAAFWAWIFTLSKAMELGDTVFLVLRKRQVPFIHYYHHSIALFMCWGFYSDYEPIFRWLGICNYFVHSILYGYLFLKSININLPRFLSRTIISIELLQMIVGVTVNVYAIWIKANGGSCAHTVVGIVLQMLSYLSFVVLFIYLFKSSYKKKATNNNDEIDSRKKKFM